jgi:hypothetical protein
VCSLGAWGWRRASTGDLAAFATTADRERHGDRRRPHVTDFGDFGSARSSSCLSIATNP